MTRQIAGRLSMGPLAAVLALAAGLGALGGSAARAEGTAADTGQIATLAGLGCNGRDASRQQDISFPSIGVTGHPVSLDDNWRIADDIVLGSMTTVKSLTLYAFGNASDAGLCFFDDVRVQIWDASPAGAANKVFGDTATNRFASCEFSNIYRDAESVPGGCGNPVMAITANVNTTLAAGTYWVDFMLGESGDGLGFVVPITVAGEEGGCGTGNCNALAFAGSWSTLNDNSTQQDVKIVVNVDTPRTIQHIDAVFTRPATPFDATPEASLIGVARNPREDELFELGWAYRVQGDIRETFFPVPDTEFYSGNSSTLGWTNVNGEGFSASEETFVNDTGLGAYILQQMTLTNLSGSLPLTVSLFHMLDPDLAQFSDDDARLVAWTPGRVLGMSSAGSLPLGDYYASKEATTFLVRANGAEDVGALLDDTSFSNFNNTTVPLVGVDITAGYQYPLVIPAASSRTVLAAYAVNYSLQCDGHLQSIYCDGFEYSQRVPPWSTEAP